MYFKGDFPQLFNCLENQNYTGPSATFRIFFSGNSFKVGLPNICIVVQENLIEKVLKVLKNRQEKRLIFKIGTIHPHGLNERFSFI